MEPLTPEQQDVAAKNRGIIYWVLRSRISPRIIRDVGGIDAAEEIATDAYLTAVTTYDAERSKLTTWALRQIRYALADEAKKQRRRRPHAERYRTDRWREQCDATFPPRRDDRAPDEALLPAALDALAPDDAALLREHIGEGVTLRAIASREGKSHEAVRLRVVAALQRAREAIGLATPPADRRRGRVPADVVAAVRASTESQATTAARYNLSQSTVNAIRRFKGAYQQ